MATADEYAAWIVQNADKKGTPDFDIVVKAYQEAGGARPPQRATLGDVASHTGKALLATMQGPTFGFGDEIIGGVVGGAKSLFNDKPLRQNYEETRDAVRSVVKQQERDEPVRTAASQLLTSMAWGGPLARFLPAGTGMAGQAATVGGVGMVSGAVNALGDSQAKDASGLAGDAGVGAGIGLAMGGLGVPLMRGAGAAGQAIASNFSDSAALQYARQKVAEAFARDQRPVQQAVTRMDRLGPEATVADTGGQNTRQLLDTLALLPGRTKNEVETVIRNRQAGRADRMIDAAESASGTGGLRMSTEMGDWMAQREAAAGPLYETLRQMTVQPNASLTNMIGRAEQLGATQFGQKMAIARNQPWTLDTTGNQPYSMRDLDNLKKGMDQLISKETKPDGKLTPLGASYDDLRRDLIKKLDQSTMGQYKAARDAFAGPSAIMDAATAGRNALTKDDATIKTMQAGMSRSEKDAFALGAFESLRAKLGARAGQTQMMELWREQGMQEKLKAIFGTERAYREFASSVAKERQLKQLETVGRGSQTAARMYGAGDLDMPAIQAAGQMVGNASAMNVPGVLQSGANLWNRVKLPEPARDQMGQILLSRNRQGLLDLEDTMRQVEESRRRQAASYGISLPGLLGF
jgi:hypothetical protein